MFTPNFDRPNLQHVSFFLRKIWLFKKYFFVTDIDCYSISVPTCLHLLFQSQPKSLQKSIPRWINFLIDFWMGFLSIGVRLWKPSWGRVGHIFFQNGRSRFCLVYVFFSHFLCETCLYLGRFAMHSTVSCTKTNSAKKVRHVCSNTASKVSTLEVSSRHLLTVRWKPSASFLHSIVTRLHVDIVAQRWLGPGGLKLRQWASGYYGCLCYLC